jgi:hypothetical protein
MKNPSKRLGHQKEEEEIKSQLFFKRIDWGKIEAREVQPPHIPKIVSAGSLIFDFLSLSYTFSAQ